MGNPTGDGPTLVGRREHGESHRTANGRRDELGHHGQFPQSFDRRKDTLSCPIREWQSS